MPQHEDATELDLELVVLDTTEVEDRSLGGAPYILITLDELRYEQDPSTIPMRVEVGGGIDYADAAGLLFLLDRVLVDYDSDVAADLAGATKDPKPLSANAFTTYDSPLEDCRECNDDGDCDGSDSGDCDGR